MRWTALRSAWIQLMTRRSVVHSLVRASDSSSTPSASSSSSRPVDQTSDLGCDARSASSSSPTVAPSAGPPQPSSSTSGARFFGYLRAGKNGTLKRLRRGSTTKNSRWTMFGYEYAVGVIFSRAEQVILMTPISFDLTCSFSVERILQIQMVYCHRSTFVLKALTGKLLENNPFLSDLFHSGI